MKSIKSAAVVAILGLASTAMAQVVVRAMSDQRSGNVTVLANAPAGDPREAGFSVVAGQNDFDPIDRLVQETDVRSGCVGTNAQAGIDHASDFPGINSQLVCRGFRASQTSDAAVNVNACGAGSQTSAALQTGVNVVVRIENAPTTGARMRVRAAAAATGGAGVQLRIVRPNGTNLLNLTSGSVNVPISLPNGEYTLMASISNGSVSRSTVGVSTKSADYTLGFWKECEGDLDGDGVIGLNDLALVLAAFGGDNGGDVNGDGSTNLSDLSLLLGNFGEVCS
jgi:hypothetical protein